MVDGWRSEAIADYDVSPILTVHKMWQTRHSAREWRVVAVVLECAGMLPSGTQQQRGVARHA